MNNQLNTPVALIFFTRPETLKKVFEEVRKVKPKQLFLIQDGPRDGKPDDISRIKECREIVGTDEKCGYIIDINDAEAYSEKIELIKNNGKSLYTSECRKRAETMFDKDANLKQYLDFYKELMA